MNYRYSCSPNSSGYQQGFLPPSYDTQRTPTSFSQRETPPPHLTPSSVQSAMKQVSFGFWCWFIHEGAWSSSMGWQHRQPWRGWITAKPQGSTNPLQKQVVDLTRGIWENPGSKTATDRYLRVLFHKNPYKHQQQPGFKGILQKAAPRFELGLNR